MEDWGETHYATQITLHFLLQVFVHRDFSAVRDQAMTLIQTAFTLLDQEFHKLDRYMHIFIYTFNYNSKGKNMHEVNHCRSSSG